MFNREWRETNAGKGLGKSVVKPQKVFIFSGDAAAELFGFHVVHAVLLHSAKPCFFWWKLLDGDGQGWRETVPSWAHLR